MFVAENLTPYTYHTSLGWQRYRVCALDSWSEILHPYLLDGFSSLLDDSKNNAERGPKSPFEGGQTILLGSEDERAPVAELPRQATSPPPPPISRRGIPPSTSSGGSVNDKKSDMRGRREGKRPKRFAPPWQQGSSSNFADGPGGSGRRSRRAPGGATAEGGFIPSSPPPSAGGGQGPQGNGTPPPTRVYRPPGTFDLEPGRGGRGGSGGRGSAREREDQQIFRLLNVFGNPNGMLLGAVALALGTVAFGWAWKSGALENSSPGQAMLQDPEATAYMSRESFPQDVDVTVTLDDKVVNLSQEGDVDIL